jgi:hypothetical protein
MSDFEKDSGEKPEEEVEEATADETPTDPKITLLPDYRAFLRERAEEIKVANAAKGEEGEEASDESENPKSRFPKSETLVPTTESLTEMTKQQVLADAERARREGKKIFTLEELRQMAGAEKDDE